MDKVQDIRNKLIEKYKNNDFVVLENGVKTVELINASFEADENYIFKKPNYAYIQNELNWYRTESLNVYDIKGKIPKIWRDIAGRTGNINSNYGWCIWSEENYDQYRNCLRQLLNDPTTRRACMIYNRPSIQYDWNKDGMKDFICTYATQQFIRNKRLIYCVYMRSNDAVFGYRNDVAWHWDVACSLYADLRANGVEIDYKPTIIWNAASLHVYESHFSEIENYLNEKKEG